MTTFEIGEDIDVIVAQLDTLVEEGKLDEATALANAALAQHPGDVDLVAAAAEVAIEQERFDDAIALIAQVEGKPAQVEGDEDGEAEGDEAADLDDETRAGLLSLKAHALFYRGDLDEARRTFNESVRLDPEDWTALLGRALVHERMGFRVAALLDLDHAVAIDDQEAPPFVQRGRVYLHRGQLAEALRDFGYALESDPFEEEASLQFARLQALQGDAGAAIEALERLVEHGEDDDKVAAGALLRSQLSLTLGSTQAALEDAAITIARWPSLPWGYLQRAACQLAGMDADGAIKSLKEAEKFVKDARDVPDIFGLRATAYDQQDKPEQAQRERQKAEGAPRLPAIVYGPLLNPARNVPINPDRPIDVRAILGDLFGDASRAPKGYEDALREVIDKIPEIVAQNPNVERIQIELPQVDGMRGGAQNLVIQVGRNNANAQQPQA